MNLKKAKKKGFSLVEMLIVIAVVAVLVAIVIPVVQVNTVKAAAATNAANLRNLEGKGTTIRLQYPDDFKTALTLESSIFRDAYVTIYDFLHGEGASAAHDINKYGTFTDSDKDRIIILPSGYQVTGVAGAAAIDVSGNGGRIVLEKGDPMTLVLSDDRVHAYYGTYPYHYTIENFVDIIEDGKFDGTTGDGNSGGVIEQTCLAIYGSHKWGEDGICERIFCNAIKPAGDKCPHRDTTSLLSSGKPDGKCDLCGEAYHPQCVDNYTSGFLGFDSEGPDGICDVCDKAMPHTCADANKDHKCDVTSKCTIVQGKCEDKPGDKDHKCDYGCGKDGLTACADNNSDHKCDECDKKLSDCNNNGEPDKNNHYCSVCKKSTGAHDDTKKLDGKCDICGYDMGHTCADTNPRNHKCDYEGCDTKQFEGCVWKDNGKNNHKCSICSTTKSHTASDSSHSCKDCNRSGISDCDDFFAWNASGHYCSKCQANLGSHSDKKGGGTISNKPDGVCDTSGCSATVTHTYVDNSGSGCNSDEPDNKCDTCDQAKNASIHG